MESEINKELHGRVRIHWIDNKTKKKGIYLEEKDINYGSVWKNNLDEEEDWNLFIWTEGNYSCDCNREILFLDASIYQAKCGDERFRITKLEVASLGRDDWIDMKYKEV